MNEAIPPKILVVIPVFNHGVTVRAVTEKALRAGWSVLVVDDGSTDGGTDALSGLSCLVHRLPVNTGKGAAIMAGARIASERGYDAIITIDADGQHDPMDAMLLADAAVETFPAVVIGSRRMDQENVPKSSLFGRAFSNFWVRLECGLDLPDTQSGFRLYPVAALLALAPHSKRYAFEVEIIARAAWAGVPIRSVSVAVYYPTGSERTSHFHKIKDNFRLSVLHALLVTRALIPLPHKKIVAPGGAKNDAPAKTGISVWHPIRLVKRICLEHNTAFQLATAVWMGIFLGALPLLAVHTIVIIYVTHRLHLNKVAAVAASQLCAPPLVPVMCVELGYFMRTGHLLLDPTWETLVLQIHYRLWEWFIGALLVGPFLGFLFAALTYFAVLRFRAGKDAEWEAAESE